MPDEGSSLTPNEILPRATLDDDRYSNSPSTDAVGVSDAETISVGDVGLRARSERGWGPKYKSPIKGVEDRKKFRRICDDLYEEATLFLESISSGDTEESDGYIAEILDLLECLYDCPFGEGEALKAAVVAIQSQLNNAQWSQAHVEFLIAVLSYLRARWVVNDQTVDEIGEMIEEFGLDPFRGTVSDANIDEEYEIVKVQKG